MKLEDRRGGQTQPDLCSLSKDLGANSPRSEEALTPSPDHVGKSTPPLTLGFLLVKVGITAVPGGAEGMGSRRWSRVRDAWHSVAAGLDLVRGPDSHDAGRRVYQEAHQPNKPHS